MYIPRWFIVHIQILRSLLHFEYSPPFPFVHSASCVQLLPMSVPEYRTKWPDLGKSIIL